MEDKYPSPCEKCDKEPTCWHGCEAWMIRYRYRQKQINAYARRFQPVKLPDPNKFTYAHPDETERYLRTSPCESCSAVQSCDTPCKVYLGWYNARMELVRKKAGL